MDSTELLLAEHRCCAWLVYRSQLNNSRSAYFLFLCPWGSWLDLCLALRIHALLVSLTASDVQASIHGTARICPNSLLHTQCNCCFQAGAQRGMFSPHQRFVKQPAGLALPRRQLRQR